LPTQIETCLGDVSPSQLIPVSKPRGPSPVLFWKECRSCGLWDNKTISTKQPNHLHFATDQSALLPASFPMHGQCGESLFTKFRIGSLIEIHSNITPAGLLQSRDFTGQLIKSPSTTQSVNACHALLKALDIVWIFRTFRF
jgi:hypothetical protein